MFGLFCVPSMTEDRNTIQGIVIKAGKLAEELAMRRHYVTVDTARGVMAFDPRFLVFEFTYNLILRESQVRNVICCGDRLLIYCSHVHM